MEHTAAPTPTNGYNPSTGTYARGASTSTAYGTQKVGQAYNPYTGAYGATHQGSNAYSNWGSSTASKDGQTVDTQHYSSAAGNYGTAETSNGNKYAAATATPTRTPAAAGNRRFKLRLGHTVGATRDKVQAAEGQQRLADSAEAVAVGNRGHRARAAGAAAAAVAAGVVAAPVVGVSVAVEDEDRSRPTGESLKRQVVFATGDKAS